VRLAPGEAFLFGTTANRFFIAPPLRDESWLCPFSVRIPKLNSKEKSMSSLNPKDRVSLYLFTFQDGRRCRTPRTGNHPHFCFYHAQKEARAQAAETLAKDLACFFSGDYLSACDVSTALARLIPAVIRGDIKPKLARTVAYMVQTLTQSIHISQKEYANAYGTEGWRKVVRSSVNSNYDYRFPPNPGSQQPAPPQAQPPTQPTPRPTTSTSAGAPGPTSSSVAARLQPAISGPATQPPAPHNAHPSPSNSVPAQSAQGTANPAAPAPQSTAPISQFTPATAALSAARSIVRRRPRQLL
jgi:hypothetical protein